MKKDFWELMSLIGIPGLMLIAVLFTLTWFLAEQLK